jgi:hypothetical protein
MVKLEKMMKFQINMISVIVQDVRGVASPIISIMSNNVSHIRYKYSIICIIRMEDISHILYMVGDILKKYPNTFLLMFTLLSVLKIYIKLNKILGERMINKYKKDDKWYNNIYEKNILLIIYWVIIVVFLILIYPTEIEILQKYITPYFDLTTMDYKLIKIAFSIVGNSLALYLSWILKDLKWWTIIISLFGLLWSSILAIDIVIYPGIIERGSVYLIEVLGLISIFHCISNITHMFNIWSSGSLQSNIAEDYTPTSKENMKEKRTIKIVGDKKWFSDNKGSKELREFPPKQSPLRETITKDNPEFGKLFKFSVKSIPKSDSIELDDSKNQSNTVKNKVVAETNPTDNNDKEKAKTPIKRTKTGTEITTPSEVMERVNKEREQQKPKYTKAVKRVLAKHGIKVYNPGDFSKDLVIRRRLKQPDFLYPLKDTGKEVLGGDDSIKKPKTLKELREELLSRKSIQIKKVEIDRNSIDIDTNKAVGESLKGQVERQVRRFRSYNQPSDNNKNSNIWVIFTSISDNFNTDNLKLVIEYFSTNINYFLFFSIMLSCYIIYSKIDKFIRILYQNCSEEYNNKLINNLKWSIIVLSIFLIIFFWPGNIWLIDGLYEMSNTIIYRTIKFILALIVNLLALYINITTVGIYSWKTLFSFVSLFSIIFFILMVFNESFSKFITNYTHVYIISNIIILINFLISNNYYDYAGGVNVNNIKEIKPENRAEKYIKEQFNTYEARKEGNKRDNSEMDIDTNVEDPTYPLSTGVASGPPMPAEPLSPTSRIMMDMDISEFEPGTEDYNKRLNLPDAKYQDFQPNKKHKETSYADGLALNSKESGYKIAMKELDEVDKDFGGSYINSTTGISNSVLFNDANLRSKMLKTIQKTIEGGQRIMANKAHHIPWALDDWSHGKLVEFKKLSEVERQQWMKKLKAMEEYSQKRLTETEELYRQNFKDDTVIDETITWKSTSWAKIVEADPAKMQAVRQNIEDFIEFAPNTPENIKLKALAVKQLAHYDDLYGILREWDKGITEDSTIEEKPDLKPPLSLTESPAIREAFLKRKVELQASQVEQIDRRVGREQADQNNPARVEREEEFRQRVEKRTEERDKRIRNKVKRSGGNENFIFLGINDINIANILEYMSDNIEYFLCLSILFSSYIIYIKMNNFILNWFINKDNKDILINKYNKIVKYTILLLVTIFITIFVICEIPSVNTYIPILNIFNYNSLRIVKIVLAFLINIITIYLTIKLNGIKSWKTFLSLFFFLLLIFYTTLFFTPHLKEAYLSFIGESLQGFIKSLAILIIIIASLSGHEHLLLTGVNDIYINTLKVKENLKEYDSSSHRMNNSSDDENNYLFDGQDKDKRPLSSSGSSIWSQSSTVSNVYMALLNKVGHDIFRLESRQASLNEIEQETIYPERKYLASKHLYNPGRIITKMKEMNIIANNQAISDYINKRPHKSGITSDEILDNLDDWQDSLSQDNIKKREAKKAVGRYIRNPESEKSRNFFKRITLNSYYLGESFRFSNPNSNSRGTKLTWNWAHWMAEKEVNKDDKIKLSKNINQK